MNEKKNETKEERTDKMKKENNVEVTDFDELRTEHVKENDKEKEKGKNSEEEKQKSEKEEMKEKEKAEKAKNSEEEKQKSDKEKPEEKGKTDKPKNSQDEKQESDKEKNANSEKEDSGEKKETSNSAITGSKKLADIKAAKEKEEKENPSSDGTVKQTTKSTEGKNKKALWISLGSLVGVLLIAYLAGFVYFLGHFYQDVAINGVSVSGMNKETAKNTLESFYKNYKLKIILIDDSDEIIDGNDISMVIQLKDEFSDCLKNQKAYFWFVNMFKHYDFAVSADTSWDEEALEDIFSNMDSLKKKNMQSPEDAYVGVEDGKFAIVKENLGTTIVVDKFEKSVEDGLRNVVAEINLLEQECYELPKVYADDAKLQTELDAKNEYAKNEIKLQLDDLTLEPGMELYEEVLEKKGDSYEVSENKIKKYVEKLANEYDTLGTDRTFTTSWDDKQIQTHGEAFGYVLNQEDTVKALSKALKEKKSATVEVIFDKKGYTLQGENDIGDTYIEVNLSEQHVYAYKDGKKIAEGDCVSGNESAGHGTCIGLYAIQAKLSPTVLRGEKKPVTKTITKKNKKGKKVKVEKTTYEYEYESPVTYWMQFNGGIGLHDAAGWRSTYGGSIYYYSGSHGCVNLPLDFAKTLYENFDVGTPVIVYFWDNENRK
ncbi:MAG: L,D-transpeptidase family protein [Clostridiales bacterium]|nr:L,D-transpeptidase family protein [Clostridiales bacterium]